MNSTSLEAEWIRQLLGCANGDEVLALLKREMAAEGLGEPDLGFIGFDQVTLLQSVERLQAAAHDARTRPNDAQARAALQAARTLHLAVRREAVIRRLVGTASCLPEVR